MSPLAVTPAERRLLPGGHWRGPTPYVVAIMTFAMLIVGAAGLALANAAGIVASSVEHRYSVQLPGGSRELPKALAVLSAAPGVSAIEPVSEQRMRRTLERWLGPAGGAEQLPVPALINFNLAAGASAQPLERAVRAVAPEARLVAHSGSLGPLLRSVRVLQWLALALVVLMAAATSAAVVLAARGALDTHRFTIEVMHGIGATDRQVVRLFQRKIALDAIAGAAAGTGAAALMLLLLGSGGAALAGDIAGRAPLGAADLVVLALLPIAAILLATLVARAALLAALRQTL